MTNLLRNRNGQRALGINDLGTIAIGILIAVVILGIGGTILEKIQDTQGDTSVTLANNESLTWAGNNTAISFSQGNVVTGSETVYNATDKFSTSEYTITSGSITFLNTSNDTWLTDKLNITYSYKIGSPARNATGFGLQGISTFAEFVPTIAIVSVAAIVIGIILLFFGRKRDERL